MTRSEKMPLRTVLDAGGLDAGGAAYAARDWSGPPPPVDPARILRVHKYTDPSKVRPIIREAAERAAADALKLAHPRAHHVALGIESLREGRMVLSNGTAFNCPAFHDHLEGSEALMAFVMSIGPALDDTVISLIYDKFEPLDALFLETAGWLTIEQATRVFASEMKAEQRARGYRLSLRMGPGYDYRAPDGESRVQWDLREQDQLFEMFGDYPLGVELMESAAMKPKMSRSGVFGILPDHARSAPVA